MVNVESRWQDSEMRVSQVRDRNGVVVSGFPIRGTKRFVVAIDGVGSDTHDGLSWATAKRTMSDVFDDLSSNDEIYFVGNVREELSTPAGVFDVKIIGAGNSPRHADGHTGNNGYSASTWKPPASPTAATALLNVRQQGWEFHNILFDCPVDAAAVKLLRDAGAGDLERDAGHAKFIACRFDSGKVGIENAGGAGFVLVKGCRFYRLTESGGAGIKCTSTSVAVPLNWQIIDNHFANNASHILSSMSYSLIKGNTFGRFTATLSVDIDDQPSANQGEYNIITENYLTGTYNGTAYPAGSNNEWAGNQNVAGVTTADP